MITGVVTAHREAVVPVTVQDRDGRNHVGLRDDDTLSTNLAALVRIVPCVPSSPRPPTPCPPPPISDKTPIPIPRGGSAGQRFSSTGPFRHPADERPFSSRRVRAAGWRKNPLTFGII